MKFLNGVDVEDGHIQLSDTYKIQWGGSNARIDGSNASDYIRLWTSDTERMRIDSSGNVGIGTASPDTKLHVNVASTADYVINANSRLKVKGDGTLWWGAAADYGKLTWDTGKAVVRGESGKALSLGANGSQDTIYINTSQNVGIGTTSPGAKLEVSGSLFFRDFVRGYVGSSSTQYVGATWLNASDGVFYVRSADVDKVVLDSNGDSYFNGGNVGIGTTSPVGRLEVVTTDANRYIRFKAPNGEERFQFYTGGTGNAAVLNMYSSDGTTRNVQIAGGGTSYFNGGNVGIGTTSPNAKLNVKSSDSTTDQITLTHSGNTVNIVAIGQESSHGSLFLRANSGVNKVRLSAAGNNSYILDSNVGIGTTSPTHLLTLETASSPGLKIKDTTQGATLLAFSQDSNSHVGTFSSHPLVFDTNSTERMRITSAGDVGIGTTSPLGKIDIRGNYGRWRINGYGGMYFRNDSDTNNTRYIHPRSDGGLSIGRGLTASLTGTAPNEYFTTSFDQLYIKSDGNVGIGTTSPSTSLHVVKDASWEVARFEADSYPTATVYSQAAAKYAQLNIYDTRINSEPTMELRADTPHFNIRLDDTGNVLTILDGGNVGIGTTSPSEKLEVAGNIKIGDSNVMYLGAGNDLQIYHDGSHSYIRDQGSGNLIITGSQLTFSNVADTEYMVKMVQDGMVELYYNGSKKLETTSTGVTVTGAATATTFLGDLNGTINTVTTAVTKANATNDTTVATTAFVQNLIGTIPAGLVFQGTWNAATNTPTLTSGSGTTGHFYIVSTSGSTNLDGVTDWVTGDWAVFIEQGGTDAWEKIDNSSVLDGAGTGQTVAKWDGSGTSNTLTNSSITDTGSAVTISNPTTITGPLTVNIDADDTVVIKSVGTNASAVFAASGDELYLGGGNAYSVRYPAGNNYALFDNSNARVGIGTGNPGNKLHIQDGGSGFAGTFDARNKSIIESNGEAYLATYVPDNSFSGLRFFNSTALKGFIDYYHGTQGNALVYSATGYHKFMTSGTEKVRIINNGNVGIGTTSPSAKLTIDSGSTPQLLLRNSSGTNSKILLEDNSGSTQNASITFDQAGQNNLTIATGYQSSNDENRIYLAPAGNIGLTVRGGTGSNNGNVGIGTTSPTQKLHVVGGSTYAALLDSDQDYTLGLARSGTEEWWLKTYTDGRFAIHENGVGDKVTIKAGGNVGIGTTSSSAKLDCAGTENNWIRGGTLC